MLFHQSIESNRIGVFNFVLNENTLLFIYFLYLTLIHGREGGLMRAVPFGLYILFLLLFLSCFLFH